MGTHSLLLLHPSVSGMKKMCHHQTITGLPKQFPNNINQASSTICYTKNITASPKGTTVDTTTLQPRENIQIELAFYNVTSVQVFTSMLTVVCAKTRMILVFPTAYKRTPVCISSFIPKTSNIEQHTCKHVRVDEGDDLENSIDVTKLIADYFIISLETTGGDASWINEYN